MAYGECTSSSDHSRMEWSLWEGRGMLKWELTVDQVDR